MSILSKLFYTASVIAIIVLAIISSISKYEIHQREINSDDYLISNATTMYKKIAVCAGDRALPLIIVMNKEFQAYTNGMAVVISMGALRELKDNNDALALIMGHEISHYLLRHTNEEADTGLHSTQNEALSDKLGAFLAMKAGYNVCNARRFFLSLLSTAPDEPISSSHPSNAYRYNQLKLPQCGGEL